MDKPTKNLIKWCSHTHIDEMWLNGYNMNANVKNIHEFSSNLNAINSGVYFVEKKERDWNDDDRERDGEGKKKKSRSKQKNNIKMDDTLVKNKI